MNEPDAWGLCNCGAHVGGCFNGGSSPAGRCRDCQDGHPRRSPDGYDRNGALDGFQVVSDADPGL